MYPKMTVDLGSLHLNCSGWNGREFAMREDNDIRVVRTYKLENISYFDPKLNATDTNE